MTLKTDDRLRDRIAVITGAGSGLGRASALRFAASGAKIVCADLKAGPKDATSTHDLINQTHGADRAIFVECSVTEEAQVQSLIQKAVDWGGRLDIMCNYAGIATENAESQPRRLHELDISSYDKTMAINVRGLWLCCKHAIVHMLKQTPLPPNHRGEETRGWIINAASIYGLTTINGIPAYATSKHAVVGLTKQIAVDYARDRIHCNALCPGYIETPFIEDKLKNEDFRNHVEALHPWGKIGTAEDIANAAVFLASDDAAWVSGHMMVIDGAYTSK